MSQRPYSALQPITKMLRGVLIALCVLEGANLALLVLQLMLVDGIQAHGFSPEGLADLRANGARMQVVSVLHILVSLAMLVMFLRWVFRATSNAHAFGAGEITSPGMAVGSYFIPLANLVLPYIAMSEIWRVSVSAGLWREQRVSPLVGVWWALWLAISLTSIAMLFYSTELGSTVPGLRTLLTVLIVLEIGEIARNVVMLVLTGRVHALQEAQHNLADNFGAPVLTPS